MSASLSWSTPHDGCLEQNVYQAAVPLALPCATLPKLHTLYLHDVDIAMDNLAGSSLPANLTSLTTVDLPSITSYINSLTGLRQLAMANISFPTGVFGPGSQELVRMATTLTQLTALKLVWTGW